MCDRNPRRIFSNLDSVFFHRIHKAADIMRQARSAAKNTSDLRSIPRLNASCVEREMFLMNAVAANRNGL